MHSNDLVPAPCTEAVHVWAQHKPLPTSLCKLPSPPPRAGVWGKLGVLQEETFFGGCAANVVPWALLMSHCPGAQEVPQYTVKLCAQIIAARAESYYSYQTSYWFESNYLPEKALLNWERVYKVMARDFWKLPSVPDMCVLSPVRTCMKFLQSWEFNQVFSALLY